MMRMASTAALAVTVSWRFGSAFCGLTTVFGTSWLITPLKTLPNIRVSGLMSQEVPKTVVKPQNADPNLQDTVTAKAAVEAIRIIERKNNMSWMAYSIFEMLYLFGSYFRYTRAVIDGDMFGYDEEPIFEDLEIQTGPHYICPQCGTETPATSPDGMECPSCGAWM